MQPGLKTIHRQMWSLSGVWNRLGYLCLLGILIQSLHAADAWKDQDRLEWDWKEKNSSSQIVPVPIDTIGSAYLANQYGDIALCSFSAENDSETRVIAPKHPFTSTFKLVVERSQNQHQFPDGRWQLSSISRDETHWNGIIKASRPGSYRVEVYVKSKINQSLAAEFSIGASKSAQTIKSKADPLAAQAFDIGKIKVTEPKNTKWNLKIKDVSLESFSLSHVVLRPAPEGESIRQLSDSSVILHARDATVHGTKLQYEPLPHKNTVGYWIYETDYPSWEFELLRPGRYAVEILQGCGKGHGGSHMNITVHDAKLSFLVEDTGHFQHFVPRVVGEIHLPRPDRYRLNLIPVKKAGGAVMDVRQIRLVPIADKP